MTTKLAIKHKNSLALKENKPFHGERCKIHKHAKLKGYREHLSLAWSTLSVFLVYWFILCPLIWAICYTSNHHSSSCSQPLLFWTVAFLIWIVIMCGLIISWRHLQAKQNSVINAISKYGTDNDGSVGRLLPSVSSQMSSKHTDKRLEIVKKMIDDPDRVSKNDRDNSLGKDLPPLVIHRRISGENIEDTGVVYVEKNEKARVDVANNGVEKNPSEDSVDKSPKTPMSPRELFFIDLIRAAERVESAKSPETETFFFPAEKNAKDIRDTERERNEKDEKDGEGAASEFKSKRESSYFVADVESPISEKTEFFLRIDSSVGEQMELIVEKPVLVLQSNEANLQETSVLPANQIAKDDC